MTENEGALLKRIIDVITWRKNNAEAHHYDAEAYALQLVLDDVHDILHAYISDEYKVRMEQDIAEDLDEDSNQDEMEWLAQQDDDEN